MNLFETLGPERFWRLRGALGRRDVSRRVPLVLGGCEGSGGGLVARALDAHPEIVCARNSTVFLERLADTETIAERTGLTAEQLRAALHASRSQTGFVERLMAARQAEGDAAVWADSTPANVRRLDFLFRHFPRARFVHVVRDGRDLALSLQRESWMKLGGAEPGSRRALERCADYWRETVGKAIRWRRDPRYLAVTYEDLAADPVACLQELLKRLDMEWDDAVARALDDAGERFAADPAGRWRTALSDKELLWIEERIAAGLSAFGYKIGSFRPRSA